MAEQGHDADDTPWVLPTEIPFAELKGKTLEECLFWLLDGMGARDLEWRLGGKGDGAADGGRDLEARFVAPGPEGQIETTRWWIECKGRTGTVEKDAVTSACNNALADDTLDCLVIVTNTTFSNPTRDWVQTWQARFPKPRVLLWDQPVLERMLGAQPATVLRLFENALSSAGRLQALSERFWSRLDYSSIDRARRIWAERETLEIGPMERIALIANEFAHGSIDERPWAGACTAEDALAACQMAMFNLYYLYSRVTRADAEQGPIINTVAYLLLATLNHGQGDPLKAAMAVALRTEGGESFPVEVVDLLLGPMLNALRGDLQLVCSSDCDRFFAGQSRDLWAIRNPIETYWARFEPSGAPGKPEPASYVRLESTTKPCRVGFELDEQRSCPLYQTEISAGNFEDFFAVATRVLNARVLPQMAASARD